MNCIFCRIIAGEIPCYKIYEDDMVLAFLDTSQASKGHTLVVPKEHVENMLECSDEVVSHVYKVAKKLGNALVKNLNAKGMNILTNVNEVAGQTVKHFHVHLLPRYDENDGVKIDFIDSKPSSELLANIVKEMNK